MYSLEMKNAAASAQGCIDMCCTSENVAVVSAEYISALAKYLDILNPSGIDFSKKGFFADIRIKNYWKLFAEYYPKTEAIIKKLKQNGLIAANTLLTLKGERERYSAALETFLALETDEADMEYSTQKTVALNLKSLLDNTTAEYEALSEKLKVITGMANDVFSNAVLIAKVSYQINISSDSGTASSVIPDADAFRNGFVKLFNMCR